MIITNEILLNSVEWNQTSQWPISRMLQKQPSALLESRGTNMCVDVDLNNQSDWPTKYLEWAQVSMTARLLVTKNILICASGSTVA